MSPLLQRIALLFVLALSGCCCARDPFTWRNEGRFAGTPQHDKYDHVRADAPESLKPYYDPELTRNLNQ